MSLMAKRPTVDQLKQKNIITEKKNLTKKKNFLNNFFKSKTSKVYEIFGVDLEVLLYTDGEESVVPLFQQCISFLKANALDEEGLFRVSGSFSEIEHLVKAFESKKPLDVMDKTVSAHAVASLLKRFLRELPIPLIPFGHQTKFYDAVNIGDKDEQLKSFTKCINQLPRANKSVLIYLISFLNSISLHSAKNKMNTSNLVICFGPSILRDEDSSRIYAVENTHLQASVVQYLITNYPQLCKFTEIS